MSGHSKWASIKRAKGKADQARGKLFSRLIKEITVAAKMGGGDPEGNPRLRSAINTARNSNMPNKNIENAILKGTGQLDGVSYEDATFEAYGPGGVAIVIECLTDNKNRTVSECGMLLPKQAATLARPTLSCGCFIPKVLYMLRGKQRMRKNSWKQHLMPARMI